MVNLDFRPLLTCMVVPKLCLLGKSEPTLTTGILIDSSRSTLPSLTLKETMTMVLIPWCIGSTLKNVWCLLVSDTRQTETLQFLLRKDLPSFLTTDESNYRPSWLETSIVTCSVWLAPSVVVECETEKPNLLVVPTIPLCAVPDIRLGCAKE